MIITMWGSDTRSRSSPGRSGCRLDARNEELGTISRIEVFSGLHDASGGTIHRMAMSDLRYR